MCMVHRCDFLKSQNIPTHPWEINTSLLQCTCSQEIRRVCDEGRARPLCLFLLLEKMLRRSVRISLVPGTCPRFWNYKDGVVEEGKELRKKSIGQGNCFSHENAWSYFGQERECSYSGQEGGRMFFAETQFPQTVVLMLGVRWTFEISERFYYISIVKEAIVCAVVVTAQSSQVLMEKHLHIDTG